MSDADLIRKAGEVVDQCLDRIRRRHPNKTFARPVIRTSLRGTTAGTATAAINEINLNMHLFRANEQEFLDNTIPHEMAHLFTYVIYGRTFQANGKRDSHGPNWRSVMRDLGVAEENINRLHQMDVSVVPGRHQWKCASCNHVHYASTKSHNRYLQMVSMGRRMQHNKCGGSFMPVTVQSVQQPTVVAVTATAAVGASKLDKCRQLYAQNQHLPRASVIALFVQHAGCTPAGASTYYSTCKNSR